MDVVGALVFLDAVGGLVVMDTGRSSRYGHRGRPGMDVVVVMDTVGGLVVIDVVGGLVVMNVVGALV